MASVFKENRLISVSTGWRALSISDGAELLETTLSLGCEAIELSYHVRRSVFEQMLPYIKRQDVRVTSIHNFFPAPDDFRPEEGGGELYLFTSDDPDERKLAVKYTVKAMEIAADLGAEAVVVHLGHLEMLDPTRLLRELYDAGKMSESKTTDLLELASDERKLLSPLALDRVLSCLDDLNRNAERLGVNIGVENRYHFAEFPNFEEFGAIFKEFPVDSMVRYWHDTGHAEVNSNLGYGSGAMLLNAYAQQLGGVHLHDVSGHVDHLAPGSGSVDWSTVRKFVGDKTIKVVELAPETPLAEAQAGIEFLRRTFGE